MQKCYSLVSVLFIIFIIPSFCIHLKQEVTALGNTDNFLEDSFNYFVTKQGNTVWAGALTLAWQQFNTNILKQNVKLNSSDNIVQKIVNNFNTCPFKKSDLSQSDYYIKSGYGQKTVTAINTQVKNKFPKRSFPDIDESLQDQDIISYAYLAKSFEYPIKFKVIDDFLFQNKSMKGFRAANEDHRNQVKYLYYKNKNEFLLKLKTKKQNEGVYLLRTDTKQAKVSDIIGQVNKWKNQRLNNLDQIDIFKMPVVDLDYYRDLAQVQHINLVNKNFEKYQFAKVYEGLKLKIDQSGVKVQNQGVIIAKLTATMYEPTVYPKQFILDDTFWIILKQQGKHPYLCIKVNKPIQKQSL